jgi:hypothetical protein
VIFPDVAAAAEGKINDGSISFSGMIVREAVFSNAGRFPVFGRVGSSWLVPGVLCVMSPCWMDGPAWGESSAREALGRGLGRAVVMDLSLLGTVVSSCASFAFFRGDDAESGKVLMLSVVGFGTCSADRRGLFADGLRLKDEMVSLVGVIEVEE